MVVMTIQIEDTCQQNPGIIAAMTEHDVAAAAKQSSKLTSQVIVVDHHLGCLTADCAGSIVAAFNIFASDLLISIAGVIVWVAGQPSRVLFLAFLFIFRPIAFVLGVLAFLSLLCG